MLLQSLLNQHGNYQTEIWPPPLLYLTVRTVCEALYSPFTDEKTEFQLNHLLKFSGQARLHRCLSPEVLVASLQFHRGGRGPRACNWGRAKGHSLSFLCPLESQRAGGARAVAGAGVGAGRLSTDLRAKVFGDEGLNASLYSLTLGPFLKGLLYPLPGPLPPWGSRPLTSCSHTPHPQPQPQKAAAVPYWPPESICPYLAKPAPGWPSTPR